MHRWTALAHPGLEPVVAHELSRAGIQGRTEPGAVTFAAPLARGAELAHNLHTPDRLLMQVTTGPASSYDQLAQLVRRAPWSPLLTRFAPVEVHVSASASRLRHRDALARKVSLAVRDVQRRLQPARTRGKPTGQRVHVRIRADKAEISIAAGGEHLHRRGWRKMQGKAPLRENLAASLLELAGWEDDEALLDPMCGSGTILIEAALRVRAAGPFMGRMLACRSWPALARWTPSRPLSRRQLAPILGADREHQALLAAETNARRAQVDITWRNLDLASIEAPAATGLVVTNPPYGKRLGRNVGGVYAGLGRALRGPLRGWRALFLAPDPGLARKVDRTADQLTTFQNGGVRVGVYAVDV
ncbi:MAG: hypothetical protein VX265_00950 [Myxococcota bacterium]|nr:hypothetical protein [Myxococcota bacterium]